MRPISSAITSTSCEKCDNGENIRFVNDIVLLRCTVTEVLVSKRSIPRQTFAKGPATLGAENTLSEYLAEPIDPISSGRAHQIYEHHGRTHSNRAPRRVKTVILQCEMEVTVTKTTTLTIIFLQPSIAINCSFISLASEHVNIQKNQFIVTYHTRN